MAQVKFTINFHQNRSSGAFLSPRVDVYKEGEVKMFSDSMSKYLVALGVAELMVMVARQQEHAVRLPLDAAPPGYAPSPNAGQSPPADDVDHFIHRQFERRQRLSGGNLADSRFDNPLLAQ